MKSQGYSTHLLNPIQTGGSVIQMRCGLIKFRSQKYLYTLNEDEVTCIKCKNYINNPFRCLRKYGQLTYSDRFLFLSGKYVKPVIACAINIADKQFQVHITINDIEITHTVISAVSIKELGFFILKLIEQKLSAS